MRSEDLNVRIIWDLKGRFSFSLAFSFRVSSYCESRGWKRIYNKNRDDFKLKWCETKSAANYGNFREGSTPLTPV